MLLSMFLCASCVNVECQTDTRTAVAIPLALQQSLPTAKATADIPAITTAHDAFCAQSVHFLVVVIVE